MNPLVSVVIPTYKRGYCIEECIRSVLAQRYADLDVVVVDDASGDDTRERIVALRDPRVRYFAHEHNRGGAAARNAGISQAKGDYIAFLDSDDRWFPDKIEKQIQGLRACGGDHGLSYTWLLCVDARGRETMRMNHFYEGDCRQRILISNFIGTFSNVVIRRDVLEQVGGLDETMRSCQDWDLFIRLLRLTRVHCQREYLVQYRQNGADDVRISTDPSAVVQGHRRILVKFAAEYHALPRAQRREALRVYFNAFVAVGALGPALDMCAALAFERETPLEWARLWRGLARAARRGLMRTSRHWRAAESRAGRGVE